ncbi:MAG: peptide chain release factor N(5)-glutamine methyltransferase [Candidatus Marinimicrobia bacterium]|nr:peptide chain release factor N(5)-glutamine methyltransferase [Candidatus Neomarinimicrobiota bacterium]
MPTITTKTKQVWTILDIINWGKDYLTKHGITNAKLELEWFLSDLLKCNRIDLYIRFEEQLHQLELDKIRKFITRRKTHEPFQYILKKAPFYGRDFIVNNSVLIPRPETETIIEIIKQKSESGNFLDIGTGSGCIAISLLKEKIFSTGVAIDISRESLFIANQNKLKFQIENLEFKQLDFLNENINQTFNCIVSNPPYIPPEEMKSLKDGVIKFEPEIALTDFSDGLSFYRKIAIDGKKLLNPNGFIILETGGENQIIQVKQIFLDQNYIVIIHKDQNGENRFLEITPK